MPLGHVSESLPPVVDPEHPDTVRCWRLRAVLPARDCARRHVARIPSGGGKGSPRFHPCGRCPDGAQVAAELERRGWRRPPDTIPAECLDGPERFARVRWCKSFPAQAAPTDEPLDPLRSAAMESPDDGGIEPDLAGLG